MNGIIKGQKMSHIPSVDERQHVRVCVCVCVCVCVWVCVCAQGKHMLSPICWLIGYFLSCAARFPAWVRHTLLNLWIWHIHPHTLLKQVLDAKHTQTHTHRERHTHIVYPQICLHTTHWNISMFSGLCGAFSNNEMLCQRSSNNRNNEKTKRTRKIFQYSCKRWGDQKVCCAEHAAFITTRNMMNKQETCELNTTGQTFYAWVVKMKLALKT